MSLLTVIIKGGWLMIPIGLCSLIAVVVTIERYITLRKARINTANFMTVIRSILKNREIQRAIDLCDQTPGPIASILKVGLVKHRAPRVEISEAVSNAGRQEVYHLEKNLGILGTISGLAPLLGFLGTVTGMIRAFMTIERLGGNVNASVLAGGIWEAMITTAAGLVVGIPALLLYNWFQSTVEHFVFEMESASTELMDLLGPTDPGAR
jgi:biopolymer transport protein ExbB